MRMDGWYTAGLARTLLQLVMRDAAAAAAAALNCAAGGLHAA